MAYSATGFAAYSTSKRGNAPSMYAYKTTDTIADVNTSGYFNELASILEVGDIIACGTSVGVGSMKPGSKVSIIIDGVGQLDNTFE